MFGNLFGAKEKNLIVLIEDDKGTYDLIASFLEMKGYSVKGTAKGEDGLDLVAKSQPSLVILDIMLPGMNGFDVLLKLKSQSRTKRIPVIMCTALNAIDDVEKCMNWGAAGYVTKPLEMARVFERIGSILAQQSKGFLG